MVWFNKRKRHLIRARAHQAEPQQKSHHWFNPAVGANIKIFRGKEYSDYAEI